MEPLPVPAGLEDGVQQLWRRARRNWLIYIAALVTLVTFGQLLIHALTRKPRSPGRHVTTGEGIAIAIITLVIIVGLEILLIRWLVRRFKGQFVPLSMGLKWRERRQVNRDLRHAEPAQDPLIRYVETTIARKLVVQQRWLWFFYPAILIGSGIFIVVVRRSSPVLAVIYLVLVVVLIVTTPRLIALHRGASRYLPAVGIDPADLRAKRRAAGPVQPG